MNKKFSLILLLFVTLACGLPSASPSVDVSQQPADINALETVIVQTANAAQTQTAFAMPSPTQTFTSTPTRIPSITPTPTVTFIYLLPTLTPIPSITPIGFVASGGGNGDKPEDASKFKTPQPWSCLVKSVQPPRWATIQKELSFYVFWTIENTGTSTWTRTTIDHVYKGGYRHENTKIQDTKEFVPPGDTLRVSALFIAPKNAGEYRSFFALQVGKLQFCQMKVEFVVKD